nr:UDP-N-acetylmuramoyl-L-alanine--D-glutamate ligase [Lachnospiraceae bacterium]
MEWNKEQPILVAGAGISGTNALRLLLREGYKPILYDGNPKVDLEKLYAKLDGRRDFEVVLGDLTDDVIRRVQFCAISPGIWLDRPFVKQLRDAGVPIISEISLAYHFSHGRVVVVTGTNGKTTTTTLIGHIMEAVNPETYTVGNIGRPYSEYATRTTENSLTAIEMSSFQIETTDDLVPDLLVITNIRADHLDRHGSMENYVALKKKLCLHQRPDQFTVINGDDPWLEDVPSLTKARVLRFSSKRELEEGCFLRNDNVMLRMDGKEFHICRRDEIQLLGMHNVENIMTGVLACYAMGAPADVIREQVLSFTAVPHRMEYICTKNGVKYYNDSKATNPDSVIKAMEVATPPVVLIAGGFDRHADYREMVESFRGIVRSAILLGTTAKDIADAINLWYPVPTAIVDTMEEAVKLAAEQAREGETVLLSPACASWDMYPNFEVRGDEFRQLALKL